MEKIEIAFIPRNKEVMADCLDIEDIHFTFLKWYLHGLIYTVSINDYLVLCKEENFKEILSSKEYLNIIIPDWKEDTVDTYFSTPYGFLK